MTSKKPPTTSAIEASAAALASSDAASWYCMVSVSLASTMHANLIAELVILHEAPNCGASVWHTAPAATASGIVQFGYAHIVAYFEKPSMRGTQRFMNSEVGVAEIHCGSVRLPARRLIASVVGLLGWPLVQP